jgi:hypothetical protein
MALMAHVGREGLERIVLEEYPEGVYVFVFSGSTPESLIADYLQDDFQMAKFFCEEEYAILQSDWQVIPDPGIR